MGGGQGEPEDKQTNSKFPWVGQQRSSGMRYYSVDYVLRARAIRQAISKALCFIIQATPNAGSVLVLIM